MSAMVEEYQKIDWNELLRKDLGDHSLEITKPSLDRIKLIFDDTLSYSDLDQLPDAFKSTLESQLNSFAHFANRIVNDFQDTSERQTWITEVKNKEYEVYTQLSPIYNYINTFDPARNTKLTVATKKSEERIKKLNEDLVKTEQLLQRTQKVTVESETQDYGNFFGKEAKKNKASASWNLGLMIGSVFLTAVFSIFFLQKIEFITTENLTFFEKILQTINTQDILIEFVLLSLGGYLIAHFSKVHSAEKNLYNLNTQRQNALESHKQILDSVIATESENEKEIRNAILLELTRAMFTNHETGYLKGSKDSPGPTNQIIEITKSMTK